VQISADWALAPALELAAVEIDVDEGVRAITKEATPMR
jgi:hypothetical protein